MRHHQIELFLKYKSDTQQQTLELFVPDDTEFEEDAEDSETWLVGKKLKFKLDDIHLEEWLINLRKDKEARDFLVVSFDKAIQTNKEKQNGQD